MFYITSVVNCLVSSLVPIYVIKLGDPPPKGSSKLHDPPLAQGSKPHDPPPYTKAQDSRKNLSLMQRHILKKRKPSSSHISPRVTLQMLKNGFVKGEALKILRKNSSETTLEENNSNFKKNRLMDGGYPQSLIENLLLEKFTKGSLNS